MGTVSELQYQAMETTRDICRLACDNNGNVYVITKHHNPFSAPFSVALGGCLFRDTDDKLETYELSDVEQQWLQRVTVFVKELSRSCA